MRFAVTWASFATIVQATIGLRMKLSSTKPFEACRPTFWTQKKYNGERILLSMTASSRREVILKVLVATSCATKPPLAAYAAFLISSNGANLPSEGEIASSIPSSWEGIENPIDTSDDVFSRLDNSPDSIFYAEPRFVEHVDDNAVRKMTAYISERVLQPNDVILDLCSSWTSHFSVEVKKKQLLQQVVGLGMSEKELIRNPVLDRYVVQDLNIQPKLPFDDSVFDVVLCQLSIDYLTKPLDVMKEVSRILKTGGFVAIFFSNRLFLDKAVGIWAGADDIDHAYTVGAYLHFSQGGFQNITAEDLSTREGRWSGGRIVGDPLYVVKATKGSS